MKKVFPYILLFLAFAQACTSTRKVSKADDGKIEVNFVQINDVYEIAPLNGGREGGMARVAALKKKYVQQNPNTFLVIAGDFVSPSVFNSLTYMGKPVRGKQMVEAMNAAGMDIAMFGNHEFDIKEGELQDRMDESSFLWISSNAFHSIKGRSLPFIKRGLGALPRSYIMNLRDADGTTARIGLFAIVLPFNKADYVSYTDQLETAKEMYNSLKDSVDAVIAITHQSMEDDEKLAHAIPGLTTIIGGHEHDGRFKKVGDVYITKALANAKSAYVLKIDIDKITHKTNVTPKLEMVNEGVPLDSFTNLVVQKWNKVADDNINSLGFNARKVMIANSEPLDGREIEVRKNPTNLTKLIVAAMMDAAPKADVSILNGGSIRVDDVLQPPITQYDILRTLPFGGGISQADMKGSLLIKVFNAGRKNVGIGGFLHYNEGIHYDAAGDKWYISDQLIDPAKTYRVAMAEFLFTGKEANLDFLNPKNPDVVKVYEEKTTPALADIRLAIVQYLEKNAQRYQ